MQYIKIFLKEYIEGNEEALQSAIQALKDAGASQMDCVKVLVKALKITLTDADVIVLNSQAWINHRDATEALRDRIAHLCNFKNGK